MRARLVVVQGRKGWWGVVAAVEGVGVGEAGGLRVGDARKGFDD